MSVPEALSTAVGSGSRLTALRALRDRLAGDIDVCDSARDVAALSQRFMDVLVQIEAVEKSEPQKAGTALDELSARRKAAGRPDATRKAGAGRSKE